MKPSYYAGIIPFAFREAYHSQLYYIVITIIAVFPTYIYIVMFNNKTHVIL